MLRITLFSVIVCATVATGVSAQVEAYGVVEAGAYLQNHHETEIAGWAGLELPLVKAPDQGFCGAIRAGAFYVDLEPDLQGASVFLVGKKVFDCAYTPSYYLVMGGGLIYEVLEGNDSKDAALKFELGFDFYRGLAFGIGTDYIPDPLTDDRWFVYGTFDLTPLVCW
jgi:hypothetical protein